MHSEQAVALRIWFKPTYLPQKSQFSFFHLRLEKYCNGNKTRNSCLLIFFNPDSSLHVMVSSEHVLNWKGTPAFFKKKQIMPPAEL